MKPGPRTKPSSRASAKKTTPKPAARKTAGRKASGPSPKATAARPDHVKREVAPHVISRKYLSPLGLREISSKRLTAAIKAVKKAHALNADIEI